MLFEAQDALVIFEWNQAWSDLGESDISPVIDTEEKIKEILPVLDDMVQEGIVVLSDVDIIKYITMGDESELM